MNAMLVDLERTAPLRHEEKMGAVTRLAGGLSGDVGTLVTSAASAIREAMAGGPDADRTQRLEEAVASLQRAQMIARQLGAISRGAPEEPIPHDLGIKVTELLPLAERLAGDLITINAEQVAEACWIEADAGQVEQVLFHLVVNARDAMPLGGDLTITVDRRSTTEPTFHRFGIIPAGNWSVLEVADTGLGMEESTLNRLFEPFFTTKPPGMGSGLGLATVYGIAHQLGGQVWVASAPGKGTRVGVWFPATTPRGEGEVLSDPEAAVMVVDDDEWVRAVTCRTLRRAGYGVLEAGDAEAAFELLGDVAGRCVRVIVTDVLMPGMDGVHFAGEVSRRHPDVRVVLMTGHGSAVVRATAVGAGPVLRKPFSRAQLLAAVAGELPADRAPT